MGRRIRRVMLIIETSKVYGRALLDGIGRYANTHGRWAMYVEERGLTDPQPKWLRSWDGDGMIFRSNTNAMVRAIQASGLPAVETNSYITDHDFPLVYADEKAAAGMAIDHFLERGFRSFGFCSIESQRWVDWRRQAFVAQLGGKGFDYHALQLGSDGRQPGWDRQRNRLADWVSRLPKPIAVLAANDVCGMRLLDACRHAGIAVPEQLAVLGVDNDETLCNLTTPPLSSLDLNATRIGYEAAALLDRMMRTRRRPKRPLWVPPRGIVTRHSTDVLAVDDVEVAQAMRYIRQHACEGISVRDVAESIPTTRRRLEMRFADTLGRSPKQEIMRVRLDRAKTLLRESDLSITAIAGQMGYASFNYFSAVFKRETGITALAYRRGFGR